MTQPEASQPETAAEAQFLAELNERLFVHYAQGQWRSPLGQRLLPVLPYDGDRVGQIVCAEGADVTRAVQSVGAGAVPQRQPLHAAWLRAQPVAKRLRWIEGFEEASDTPAEVAIPGQGPLILLSAAETPLSVLVAALLAGLERGVVWKPAPRAAASAHLVMRTLGPLAGGRLAMIQGDHQTGRLLHGQGALIWASAAPPPTGDTPALILAAKAPRHP